MKIDLHAHILPEKWPDFEKQFGYGGWVTLEHTNDGKAMMMKNGQLFRPVDERVWSPAARLNDMNDTGVDVQVLSTVPIMFNYWAPAADAHIVSRFLNDNIAETVASNPDRFLAFGTVPLQDPIRAAEELTRCKTELHLSGIQIGTHIDDRNIGDPFFDPFMKAAADLNMPLFIHPWDMRDQGRHSKYWLPWLVGMPAESTQAALSLMFSGTFERFPNLRVCLAHGGGALPYTMSRAKHAFDVYPGAMQVDNDRDPMSYFKTSQLFADTLVHNKHSLDLALEVIGHDNLVLGSDYPFLLGEHHPGKLIEGTQYSIELKEKLLYRNARRFLNLPETAFTNASSNNTNITE